LAQRPGFEKLQFTIAGDGLLFDETVEPIRHFENVRLIKRFLLQAEIAQLHAEHGIFLCPSRMDTHGVSRDEAMASGLVPVTSRVAAIPEFVDVSCGFMAEPEDANGLADAIERLVLDPERFMAMSKAASERVHRSTAAKHIIGHELAILGSVPVRSQVPEIMGGSGQYRIAIYGDVNLNIMDGSAVWAASLAETLACVPGVTVTLFLKAPIKRLHILESLINLNGRVRLVEPNISEDKALSVSSAIKVISEAHVAQPFDAIVLRGFDLCAGAIQQTWADLIWAYITDIPQTRETMTDEKHVKIDEIIRRSGRMLCQTHAFEDYVKKSFASAEGKTLILPPMIPLLSSAREKRADGPLRVVYAGKFAPLWGVREMFRSFSVLRQSVPDAELHVFGDKFHNPKDDSNFQEDIKRALKTQDGVYWHGAVGRNELLSKIREMDVAWAYRDSALEANTHELSTKLLEYAAAGIPVILARNHVNEELLGGDYPLFSNTETEASRILISIAKTPQLGEHAVRILTNAAQCYTFAAVADLLMRQGIFERVDSSQGLIKDTKSKKKSV
jgi:glycosyltransferase involved in cell wall biosynthesis